MRITKLNVVLIVLFTFLSAFVSRIVDLITVSHDSLTSDDDAGVNRVLGGPPYPDDTLRHIVWFLQVSDLHISLFLDPKRVQDLQEFCGITVRTIKPALVLATGDLTDAKTGDYHGSQQNIEEWKVYNQLLADTGVLGQTLWLDIRGNHDNFNVISIQSSENYYRNYSVQGKSHLRSYLYQYKQDNDTYSFVGVDACLEPGPRRPFNFVGLLNEEEMNILKQFENESRWSNATIWFGHYPTASILSPSPGIRSLMRNAHAYLCGHFHTLGGLMPNMYTLQQTGNLELELADWKQSRKYRLAAIDHGLFTFLDLPHGQWPVIMVTNPKPALYAMPTIEPLERIHHSTHIRVLVFSISPIDRVWVTIDDGKTHEAYQSRGPLYILPWNPQLYTSGLHTLRVKARDTANRSIEILHTFALDGTQLSFNVFPRLVLMSSIITVFQVVFGFFLVLSVVPLCILRILHKLVIVRKIQKPRLNWRCGQAWIRKLWLLVSIERLFYPLMFSAIYVPIGPWFIGEIIEDHIGLCFAWGMFLGEAFLPGGITFGFGIMHLLTFQIPLTLFLAHSVDCRYRQLYCERRVSLGLYLCRHIPFLLLLTWNLWIAYSILLAYGTLAFVLGPLKTWTLLLCLYLWHQVASLPEYCFDSVRLIFPVKRSTTEEQIPLNAT